MRFLPPAIVEFVKIRKYVASKIGKDGKPAVQIASNLKKEVEAAHGKLHHVEMSKKAIELFDSNPSKYTVIIESIRSGGHSLNPALAGFAKIRKNVASEIGEDGETAKKEIELYNSNPSKYTA